MMFSNLLLGASLAVVSPTNAPAMFSTETEQTFLVPDITERSVWLDCGIDFTATPSNRIEVAFGPDVDGDGLLGDDESPFSLVMDCGRMIVRDGKGNQSCIQQLFLATGFISHSSLRMEVRAMPGKSATPMPFQWFKENLRKGLHR